MPTESFIPADEVRRHLAFLQAHCGKPLWAIRYAQPGKFVLWGPDPVAGPLVITTKADADFYQATFDARPNAAGKGAVEECRWIQVLQGCHQSGYNYLYIYYRQSDKHKPMPIHDLLTVMAHFTQ
jgi:hypothetical protein